ncbi:MAG: hypothetical protein ACP5EQ_06255 [Candidatus Cloacimonadia bacterium]
MYRKNKNRIFAEKKLILSVLFSLFLSLSLAPNLFAVYHKLGSYDTPGSAR